MRASIVMAAYNEGDLLLKTVESVREIAWLLDMEIVVADDCSDDGSIERLLEQAPEVQMVSNPERMGCPPARDLAARCARGDVLVFLDAHTKPEQGAILRLVSAVEEVEGDSIILPRVPVLDVERWEILEQRAGYGFSLLMPSLDGHWLRPDVMVRRGRFYESPCLCGCAFAMSRKLYERLRGVDRDMREWGSEDLDLGLKAWLMGHSILNDPYATVAHRFVHQFPYRVAPERIIANKIRIARKNFTEENYQDWLRVFSATVEPPVWEKAREMFRELQASAEEEREYLMRHRVHDELWFAKKFGCEWPPAARATPSPGPHPKLPEAPA